MLVICQDGRVMMLEPAGEEDEADLLHHRDNDDNDDDNQSGQLLTLAHLAAMFQCSFILFFFHLV